MNALRMRFFIKPAGGEIHSSDLTIQWPEVFSGFPGKPKPVGPRPIYQSIAHFPGVLPPDGIAYRSHSNFDVILQILGSVAQFCTEFEKAGGVFFFPMHDDENKPFLEEPVKAKKFFKL